MNISRPWFLQRFFETVKPVQEPDAADMGTAYGMECSLAAQEPKPAVPAATPAPKPSDRR